MVRHPSKCHFVINDWSYGHNDVKALVLNTILLQYSLPDIARRITIVLMVDWDESSIFVN